MCVGKSMDAMYMCHMGCMSVERGDVSFDRFLCSVSAGRVRLARRDSIVVRRGSFMPLRSPLGSLAIMTLVGCI